MKTAQTIIVSLTISMVAVGLRFPKSIQAAAGSLQICEPSGDCAIGEFLYDDSYVPITGASCTLTAKNPDGTALYTNQAMSAGADGYYSYSFTSSTVEGIYPTQVCCTSGSDYLCLDKSFEVKESASSSSAPTTSEISSAVWGYSNRTLSGFGTLVTDIWNSSTRTITSLITGTTNITNDISDLEDTVNQTRLLLEELVNKPIIETTLEEEKDFDLGAKLKDTKGIANQLYVNSQFVSSKASEASLKYKTTTSAEITTTIDEISALLGGEEDKLEEATIFGGVNWLAESWDFQLVGDIKAQVVKLRGAIASIEKRLVYSNAKPTLVELKSIATESEKLEKLVGNVSDDDSEPTLFGKVKEVENTALALDNQIGEIDKTLANWKGLDTQGKESKVKSFLKSVLSLNILPKIKDNVLSSKLGVSKEEKELRNNLLSMKGVLSANKTYLAKKNGKTVLATWLEEGSIVFKTLVTNPSTLISQTVKVEYFLPPEVREEHILETDPGLEIKYDAEKDQYYVVGEVALAKGESKTLSVRVDDIWVVTESEIESKRNQAEDLFSALKNTSFFAQGVTLKSDINVSLDKIVALQASANTPEQKIRANREAKIELAAADEKMDMLQSLVTQAGSAGNLFGFVGGAQALAVWGLIIILVAGFVFLAIYMRTITGVKTNNQKPKESGKPEKKTHAKTSFRPAIAVLVTAVVSGGVSALIAGAVLTKFGSESGADEKVLGENVEEPQKEQDVPATGGVEVVLLVASTASPVNTYADPDLSSKIVSKVTYTQAVVKLSVEGDWTKISLAGEGSKMHEAWVLNDNLVLPETAEMMDEIEEIELDSDTVVINQTPTGWLRVREAPWGVEIAKVDSGVTLELLDTNGDWYMVQLEEGVAGWVSSEYATVE